MKGLTRIIIIVALTLLPVTAFAKDPPAPPGPPPSSGSGMYTLQELYDYLTTGKEPAVPGPFKEPTAGPAVPTMYTLKEIYEAFKDLIDQCSATPEQVLSGQTFFSTTGTWGPLGGEMTNVGQQNVTPGTAPVTLTQGYHDGTGTVAGDEDLTPANIVAEVTIFDVTGTAPTLVPDPNLLPENIKCGVTIYGVLGGNCVAQTGQTSCWDANGNSIPCANTGQDGEYQKGCPPVVAPAFGSSFGGYNRTSLNPCAGATFTDNGDGTVTDNWTGLIWLKNASCWMVQMWASALSSANNLAAGQCGLTDGSSAGDWRLPNLNELRSLFAPGRPAPYLPAGHPFVAVMLGPYWTSTTAESEPDEVWYMDLNPNTGGVGVFGKVSGKPTYNVWPVRGGR